MSQKHRTARCQPDISRPHTSFPPTIRWLAVVQGLRAAQLRSAILWGAAILLCADSRNPQSSWIVSLVAVRYCGDFFFTSSRTLVFTAKNSLHGRRINSSRETAVVCSCSGRAKWPKLSFFLARHIALRASAPHMQFVRAGRVTVE